MNVEKSAGRASKGTEARAIKKTAPGARNATQAGTAPTGKKVSVAKKSAAVKKKPSPRKTTTSVKKATAAKKATNPSASKASQLSQTTRPRVQPPKSKTRASSGDPGKASRASMGRSAQSEAPPESAARSQFFRAARERAERIVRSPEKLRRIADESTQSAATRSGPFASVLDDFRALIRLVVAYSRGQYRDIPLDALITVVAGLVYVVSPIDLIPDVLPGGFVDDAAVVAWVIRTVRSELSAFRSWEADSLGG